MKIKRLLTILAAILILSSFIYPSATIPSQAWNRDVGATGYKDGAPIGGFGAGTITWKYDGIFYKDRLKIGHVGSGLESDNIAFTDDATARFYLYQKTSGAGTATVRKLDAATLGAGQAKYYSLFPMSWVDYYGTLFDVKATVTQFSPIIPNDYQRVSYPMGIYEWEITNPSATQSYDASIMLTWNNDYSGVSATAVTNGNFKGIVLHRTGTGAPTLETEGEFALGSINGNGVTVTVASSTTAANLVTDFTTDGKLSGTTGANTIGAVSFAVTLAPGETIRVPIVLAWDIPIYQVGTGDKWWKRFTRYFGRTGRNAWAMIQEALTNHASWESQIDSWQSGILSNPDYPNWMKSMVFNELYIYFTGGTVWEAGGASGQADEDSTPEGDMFSHLESYIYPFYGTSDVRFYGSWALFMNWPDIDKQAVKQFCDSVQNTRSDRAPGEGTTAHDLGGIYAYNPPGNTCVLNGTQGQWYLFDIWNCYRWRSACDWKDLNSKLVLMVYRDWKLSGSTDTAFLNYCYNPVKIAMAKVKSQDTDGKGLPNSTGIDQTYDDMDLTGDTAYCGSLFLSACLAAKELAIAAGDITAANTYQAWFDLAAPNFENQLWTGSYYKIDTGSTNTMRIMSDQLCGQWYADAVGLPDIVVNTRAARAYQTIYDNNFMKFGGGAHGVVNVMLDNGTIDTSTVQTNECWVGTSWGDVAGMIHMGMLTQADAIGQSIYNTIWNTSQLWFRTPEAWKVGVTNQRAYYYMRGTTVWAVKWAYDHKPVVGTPTNTPTATMTRTNTPYYSPTSTRTNTPFVSSTATPTYTNTPVFTATQTFTATPTFSVTATFNPVRVNCAGPGYASPSTLLYWEQDQAYGGANTWGYTVLGNENTRAYAINGTLDDTLYQSERWNAALGYSFDVPDGTYEVTLKFCETWFGIPANGGGGALSRRFNVALEGTQVLTNFDIYAAAGNAASTAVDRVFNVTVTDGTLNINLTSGLSDNPLINAIQVLRLLPSPTHTPSYTATNTNTPAESPTFTGTKTQTSTATPTSTGTYTATDTPVVTPTHTNTKTATPSVTETYTITVFSPTFTLTATATGTMTVTRTDTPVYSPTSTPTATLTMTGSPPTQTFTPSVTQTHTLLPTGTFTATRTSTPVNTATLTSTKVPSATYTRTAQPTNTNTPQATATPTATKTAASVKKDPETWPNPVDADTQDLTVAYYTAGGSKVFFRVYTVNYRLITQVQWNNVPQGYNEGTVDRQYLRKLASGMYYFVVVSDSGESTKLGKFVVIR